MKKILKLMHRQFCIFILFKLALEQMSEIVSLMLQSWNKIYLHGIKIELKKEYDYPKAAKPKYHILVI